MSELPVDSTWAVLGGTRSARFTPKLIPIKILVIAFIFYFIITEYLPGFKFFPTPNISTSCQFDVKPSLRLCFYPI